MLSCFPVQCHFKDNSKTRRKIKSFAEDRLWKQTKENEFEEREALERHSKEKESRIPFGDSTQ